MRTTTIQKLKQAPISLYIVYLVIYIAWGFAMDSFVTWAEIAKFNNWWQVLTCYGLYMIPISIVLKGKPFFEQYAYGLVAMGLLEFSGYYFETSYAYPDNIIEQTFGIRNFALGMALFFALYFPLGNLIVGNVHGLLFKKDA